MGASSCAQQKLDVGPNMCCSGNRATLADTLAEYEPQSKQDTQREHIEPAPPAAVAVANDCASASEGLHPHVHAGGNHLARELRAPSELGPSTPGGDCPPQAFRSPRAHVKPASPAPTAVLKDCASAAGGRDDESQKGESYFERELKELSELEPSGPFGDRPLHKFRSDATYKGQWRGNQRHGIGHQTWSDGTEFVGQWSENMAKGLGEFAHAHGLVFIGQWRQNSAHGLGLCYHNKGSTTYRGQWVEDLQHGHGVEHAEGGEVYCGQFVKGKKEGYGVYEWPDGSQYSGEWRANSINGFGRYLGPDGREFHGQWREAVIHGMGKYHWPDGRSFCGQYCQDQKHGFGILEWRDGRFFEGFWCRGQQHGDGIMYSPTNERTIFLARQGTWVMGKEPEDSAVQVAIRSRRH